MKKKYLMLLSFSGLFLILILGIGISYYLYRLNNRKDVYAVTNGCIKTIYSNSSNIITQPALILTDDNGKSIAPYTITYSNLCKEDINVELRMTQVNKNEINPEVLKVYINGDIKLNPTIYNNLVKATTNANNQNSKIIDTFKLKGLQTIQINARLWIDAQLGNDIAKQQMIKAKLELSTVISDIKPTFAEVLINAEGGEAALKTKVEADYTKLAKTAEGLIPVATKSGQAYYYRGQINNNYVSYANLLWRIVAINPDLSVRLILESTTYPTTQYNTDDKLESAVGYTYVDGEKLADSKIKIALQEWYTNNLKNLGFNKNLVAQNFCNDTSSTLSGKNVIYGPQTRLYSNPSPTLNCPETNNEYGGKYNEYVGLLTADEVAIAGGVAKKTNLSYYLVTNTSYFLLSPSDYYKGQAYVMVVNTKGEINDTLVNNTLALRPVINLKASVTVSGSGLQTDPYVIDLDT